MKPIASSRIARWRHGATSAFALVLGLIGLSPPALACASCGCSINADWGSQGLSAQEGWSLDLKLDILDQNQLRYGTRAISASNAALVANPQTGGPAEVEQYTRNRYLSASLDYNSSSDWGLTITLPMIQRRHATLGTGSDGVSPGDGAYVSDTTGLGDVKVVARYLGLAADSDWGLQFGLKLPTGSHRRTGVLTDPAGPPGMPAPIDPGLQPGTGTTDLIAGVFAFGQASENWSWFTQAGLQHALATVDGYAPGDALSLAGGLRFLGWERLMPQLQFNLRRAVADRGPNADTFATGGTLAYLTPGVVIPLAETTTVYAFVQLPVVQNVRGIQLVPRAITSIGLHTAF
jgi:hypothetical protein